MESLVDRGTVVVVEMAHVVVPDIADVWQVHLEVLLASVKTAVDVTTSTTTRATAGAKSAERHAHPSWHRNLSKNTE